MFNCIHLAETQLNLLYIVNLNIEIMGIENLKTFVREKISLHPNLKEGIMDYYQLCLDEIEEGGSESNEIHLCISSIDDLIKESV